MSKFYKEVATPQTQGRQAVRSNAPTQDVNARQEAMNEVGGLGGAIQSLLGVVNAGASAIAKHDEAQVAQMESSSSIEADSDARDGVSKINKHMEAYALEQKKPLFDLTPEEYEQQTKKAVGVIGEEFNDKHYKPIILQRLAEKRGQYLAYISKKNKKAKFDDKTGKMAQTVLAELNAIGPNNAESFAQSFKFSVEDSLGEIDASKSEIATALLGSLFKSTTLTENAVAAQLIGSPSFQKVLKEEYGMKDVQAGLNAMDQAMSPAISKQRKLNGDRTEDEARGIIIAGGATPKDIKSFIKERKEFYNQPENKVYSPRPEFWTKLDDDLLKLQNETESYDALGKAVLSGEHTAIASSTTLTEKQKTAATERLMFTQSGVDTTNFKDVHLDIMTEERIATAINNNVPLSDSLINQFKVPTLISDDPEKPFKNYREQKDAYIKLNGDTAGKLGIALGGKTMNRLKQQDHILSLVDSKILTAVDGEAQLANITSDIDKNTSALGGYKSEEGLLAFEQYPEFEEEYRDIAGDADFTWDTTKNQDQVFTYMSSTFHHLSKAGIEPNEANRLTKQMVKHEYRKIENPDGSEVSLPREVKSFDWDVVFDAVRATDGIKDIYEKMSSLDKEWDGDLNVHVPRNWSARKQVIIRLGDKNKLFLDAEAINKMVSAYKVSDREQKLENYSVDLKNRKVRKQKEAVNFMKGLKNQ